ncbi:hypothetical protein PS2_039558 [Malus domestica]
MGASNQSALTDDEDGWTLVTYKKTRKPRPQAVKPKAEQARQHCCHNNKRPKKNVRAAKLTYAEEPMQQEPHIPVSLHEYFPNDFFQQCTTATYHMVEVEIKEPSKGKVIAVEEEKTHA